MTNRRDDEREGTEEAEERLREERVCRSDELGAAWRRNHPSEGEEGGKGRPGQGRQA